jgi:hypothetical protein
MLQRPHLPQPRHPEQSKQEHQKQDVPDLIAKTQQPTPSRQRGQTTTKTEPKS